MSFVNEGNSLGFGTCATMLEHHSTVLCCSVGSGMLRGRRPSGLASACLIDSAYQMQHTATEKVVCNDG